MDDDSWLSCICIRRPRSGTVELGQAAEGQAAHEMLLGLPVKGAVGAVAEATQAGIRGAADLTVSGVGVVADVATDVAAAGLEVGLEVGHWGAGNVGEASKAVASAASDFTREVLIESAETDVAKLYGHAATTPQRGCFDHLCMCVDLVPAFAAISSIGSPRKLVDARAKLPPSPSSGGTFGAVMFFNRLRRRAALRTPLVRDLSSYVGRWSIVLEQGRSEYLLALDLNWMVRSVAESMATPPITFVLDENKTLHSQQGPLFGRMVVSVHPQKVTTIEENFQGVVSSITSTWEDGPDGKPILFCRTTTRGKSDVCDQRSRVDVDHAGRPSRLTVETRLTKYPGAPIVFYDRIYEPMPPS